MTDLIYRLPFERSKERNELWISRPEYSHDQEVTAEIAAEFFRFILVDEYAWIEKNCSSPPLAVATGFYSRNGDPLDMQQGYLEQGNYMAFRFHFENERDATLFRLFWQ